MAHMPMSHSHTHECNASGLSVRCRVVDRRQYLLRLHSTLGKLAAPSPAPPGALPMAAVPFDSVLSACTLPKTSACCCPRVSRDSRVMWPRPEALVRPAGSFRLPKPAARARAPLLAPRISLAVWTNAVPTHLRPVQENAFVVYTSCRKSHGDPNTWRVEEHVLTAPTPEVAKEWVALINTGDDQWVAISDDG